MKYVVGASIGGLFGLSLPMMVDIENISDKSPRIEYSQPVEEETQPPINMSLILPDNICSNLDYSSDNVKEQAKECLQYTLEHVPSI